MKHTIFIVILLIYFSCKPGHKVVSDNDWNGYHYSYFCPAYCFSETGKLGGHLDILNPNHISLVPENGKKAIEEAKQYLRTRGGVEFLNKASFYDIDITYLDSLNKFNNKSPLYNLEKCGETRYFVRFLFKPMGKTEYRFGVAMNDQFQVISKPVFPDHHKHPGFHNIISPDAAIGAAKKKHASWIEPIESIELIYAENLDCFVWEIISERKFKKGHPYEFKQGYVDVNANTGKKIDTGSIKGNIIVNPHF